MDIGRHGIIVVGARIHWPAGRRRQLSGIKPEERIELVGRHFERQGQKLHHQGTKGTKFHQDDRRKCRASKKLTCRSRGDLGDLVFRIFY